MNWHTNLVLLVTLVVGHIFTAAAQNASGSVTTCLVSQYLDDSTGECVNYKDQGEKAQADYGQAVNSGNTAWLLTASAMVMIMTPGVAFFYAGLAGEKMASNTILMSFVSMALVSIQFWAFGYSVAFGSNGMFEWAAYNNVGKTPSGTYGTEIPHILFALFQTQFAMISPALLSGGIVGRMKYGTFLLFIFLWTSLVYDPLAYWMWSLKLDDSWAITNMGWEGKMGSIDFAGGTVIHISSGFGALAAALMVGKRYNHNEAIKPHNVPLVMIGVTLLWFGWFGFNAGSQGAADGIAATAAINTHLASSAGFLTWVGLEYSWYKKIDPCGVATGAVAGLVAITPACGYVYPWAAVIFGIVGAITGFAAIQMKKYLRYDDTLDSFAIHGCVGVIGGLMTGLFATSDVNPNIDNGAFYENGELFLHQLVSQCFAAAYSFAVTLIILLVLKLTIGLRVDEDKEVNGIDISYHGGLAYDYRVHENTSKAETRELSSDFMQ
ncbi:putative ammonium transporter, ammonium/urea transporter [Plasmopara halstedii]